LANSLKTFFLENHWATIAHIYMKDFWHSADLSLYKLLSLRIKVGDARGDIISTFVYWKGFIMKHLAIFNKTGYIFQILHDWNSSLFKWRSKSPSNGGWSQKCKNRVGSPTPLLRQRMLLALFFRRHI
jgi:hypothetical protein